MPEHITTNDTGKASHFLGSVIAVQGISDKGVDFTHEGWQFRAAKIQILQKQQVEWLKKNIAMKDEIEQKIRKYMINTAAAIIIDNLCLSDNFTIVILQKIFSYI